MADGFGDAASGNTYRAPVRPMAVGRGFAVPTVMFMMLATFAVATVALVASLSSQRGVVRDQDSKQAFAVAEAGISQALLHYNTVPTTGDNTCVVSNGGTLFVTAPVGGWCPEVQGATQSGAFSYTVAPASGEIEIVAVGESDGVTRRARRGRGVRRGPADLRRRHFVKTQDGLTMDANAQIRANTATNGDITMSSESKLCGQAWVGVGRTLTLLGNAAYYETFGCTGPRPATDVGQKPLVLPPVNQGDAPTNNDNDRFFSQDPISGKANDVTWDPTTRLKYARQQLGHARRLVYSLCTLEMSSNTAIYVAPGSQVRIYFDARGVRP